MDTASEQSEALGADIDLPPKLCGEIKDFARLLPDMTYHEVLGIERDSDAETVRRAFFQRSKTYHPDRYFQKRLGPYEGLLHEIYKRVVAAHEVLRDGKLRKDYEATLRAEPTFRIGKPSKFLALPGAEKSEPEPESGKGGRSLRSRKGLRSRATVFEDLQARLEASRRKARGHFQEAQREIERGDFVHAASLVRLALAFDPREHDYHNALAEVVPQANAETALASRAKGEMLLARGNEEEALEYLEEAFRLVPTDAELAQMIADTLLKHDAALDRAADFARQAAELDERSPVHRKTLGLILMRQGDRVEARRELQRAWELDPMDKDVKKALSVL